MNQFLFVIGIFAVVIIVGIMGLVLDTLAHGLAPTNSDNFGDDE